MTLLRIDSSLRTVGSVSRAVADSVQQTWQQEHDGGEVVRRDLGANPIDPQTLALVLAAGQTPAEEQTPEQAAAVALTGTLLAEVLAADSILIAAPLYNFGVPAALKTWFDLLFTTPDLGAGGSAPLTGRPAVLVIARGGGYGEGTPRAGWDHSTPWLERVLSDIFGLDLKTVAAELTLADVVPAMAELRDIAAQSLAAAHSTAAGHGRHLAGVTAAV